MDAPLRGHFLQDVQNPKVMDEIEDCTPYLSILGEGSIRKKNLLVTRDGFSYTIKVGTTHVVNVKFKETHLNLLAGTNSVFQI